MSKGGRTPVPGILRDLPAGVARSKNIRYWSSCSQGTFSRWGHRTMPWYGFYSEKQRRLFGYAEYLDTKEQPVAVTEVSPNEKYVLAYRDRVRVGRLTYFCRVRERNSTKRLREKVDEYILPSGMELEPSEGCFIPQRIIN